MQGCRAVELCINPDGQTVWKEFRWTAKRRDVPIKGLARRLALIRKLLTP